MSSLDELISRPAWQRRAACHSLTSLFFAAGSSDIARWDQERAKAVCQVCPVREECLQFALESDEAYGIWGGLTSEERRACKRASSLAQGISRRADGGLPGEAGADERGQRLPRLSDAPSAGDD